jgi:hypothetical protein
MTVTRSRASFSRVMKGAGGQETDERTPAMPEAGEPGAAPVEDIPPCWGGRI